MESPSRVERSMRRTPPTPDRRQISTAADDQAVSNSRPGAVLEDGGMVIGDEARRPEPFRFEGLRQQIVDDGQTRRR